MMLFLFLLNDLGDDGGGGYKFVSQRQPWSSKGIKAVVGILQKR